MANEAVDRQQQEMRNFMSMLPLTIEIAGLPATEPGRYLNEAQMEIRANNLKHAYKIAKKVVRDVAKDVANPGSTTSAG